MRAAFPYTRGQCMVGSFAGAADSEKVPESHKDTLKTVRNGLQSVKAYVCLTVRQTGRAGTKVGFSDPGVLRGWALAQRMKGTLGITGSYYPRAHIDGSARHLDVDSSYPGAEEGPKGSAVRR